MEKERENNSFNINAAAWPRLVVSLASRRHDGRCRRLGREGAVWEGVSLSDSVIQERAWLLHVLGTPRGLRKLQNASEQNLQMKEMYL